MGSIRRIKTKRMTRHLDQIHTDLRSPPHLARHTSSKPPEDLPGLGQHYCIECAKWFEGAHNLVQHRRGKNHKRRVRALREMPFTQREAEAAVGVGVERFDGERRRAMGQGREEGDVKMEGEGEGVAT